MFYSFFNVSNFLYLFQILNCHIGTDLSCHSHLIHNLPVPHLTPVGLAPHLNHVGLAPHFIPDLLIPHLTPVLLGPYLSSCSNEAFLSPFSLRPLQNTH